MRISDWSSDVGSSDLGAKSVKCLDRRDRENMPGSQREVANAEEEGVEFVWLSAPLAFEGTEHVTGVKATRMRLGAADASGRRAPEADPGTEFTLEADLVIKALGFDAERSEEHTSELQSLMRISYAVFCLNNKKTYQL